MNSPLILRRNGLRKTVKKCKHLTIKTRKKCKPKIDHPKSPPNDKPKWELKMLSDRLIELNVVEHISVTMVRRVLKKMS